MADLSDARVQQMADALGAPALGMMCLQGKDLADVRTALEQLAELRSLISGLNITSEELLRLRNECEVRSDKDVKIWGKFLQMIVDHVRHVRASVA